MTVVLDVEMQVLRRVDRPFNHLKMNCHHLPAAVGVGQIKNCRGGD